MILLLFAIFYLFKRPRFKKLSSEDFPQVPSEEFERWRSLEIQSIDVFCWIQLAGFLLSLIGGFIPQSGSNSGGTFLIWGFAVPGVVLLVGLVISAIIGTKAQNLKKSLGIAWK